jgi:hypothetical protein
LGNQLNSLDEIVVSTKENSMKPDRSTRYALVALLVLTAMLLILANVNAAHAETPQQVLDEIARLNTLADSQPENYSNPHPRHETFSNWPSFDGADWTYLLINGNGGNISVNGPTTFDNSSAGLTTNEELIFGQVYDPDHDSEYPYQYNNVAMIGMQGYMPTASRDIIWTFDMKIEPGFYGTTGFVIEPQGTFASDGSFALPFDFAGISYAGPENVISGLRCTSVINWTQVDNIPIANVDPFAWNEYKIMFQRQGQHNVTASVFVNETQVCQMDIPNFSQTEVQIWSDNYLIMLDPSNPGNPVIGFNNKESPQSVLFDEIAVRAHP